MSRYLHKGDVILKSHQPDAQRFIVVDANPIEGCFKVFDSESRSEVFLTQEEVHRNIGAQRWSIQRPNAPQLPLTAKASPELAARLHQAQTCLRLVEDTAIRCGLSFLRAYDLVSAEHDSSATRSSFPSRATLYRYRRAKLHDLPLQRGSHNKGRRTPRYKPEVDAQIIELGDRYFLQAHSRWRLGPLTKYLNTLFKDRGVIPATGNLSSRYVNKVLEAHKGPDLDSKRMDPKSVAAARSIGATRQLVYTPWERVEQDAVHMPFAVQTPHGISSDIWLVLAIDCATGMVVGWQLVVGRPTESDSLACVHTMMNSKVPHFSRLGLTYPWDIHGSPGLLVMDNGPETQGERMQKLALLDIEVQYCQSRHPQQKPYVERLNKSLKEALETLPGCTRMDGVDGKRQPIVLSEPLMSLQELEIWIVRWFYESWAHQPLKRHARTESKADGILGRTPIARWQHLTEASGYASPLPIPEDTWRKAMLVRDVRTVSNKSGITFKGLNYTGRELPFLVERFLGKEVTVLTDPADYRFLFVEIDANKPLVVLTHHDAASDSPAYSMGEYKQIEAEQVRTKPKHEHSTQFIRDIATRSMQAPPTGRKRKSRSAEQNRDTTQKARESAAIRRAIENPLPPTQYPGYSSSSASISFEELPALDVLDRHSGGKR